MRIVNLGAVLEYGRALGVIHPSGSLGTRESSSLGGAGVRVVAKKLMTIIKDEDADKPFNAVRARTTLFLLF